MARKQRGHQKVSRLKVASDARRKKSRSSKSVRDTSTRVNVKQRNDHSSSHYTDFTSGGGRVTPQDVNPRFQAPLGPIDPAKLYRGTRDRVIGALGELRSNPKLSFSKVASRWHIDTRTLHRHAKSALRTDNSGRIHARPNDRIQVVMQIPTTKPGEYRAIVTRSSKERKLLGEYWAAINDAKAGKIARLNAFPKNTFIDGTRLPTGRFEVQKLLEALESEGSKFAGPYRVRATVKS
jgi:hypothetical protein